MSQLLEIDSEGYPLLDNGIRIDDEDFLKEVFLNLRRQNNDSKYPLLTKVANTEVTLFSFDDPLVATEVSLKNNTLFWSLLGGLELQLPLQDLRVDEWNRFHAYIGKDQIPAVMSSKAQARFLNSLEFPEKITPLPFRNGKGSDDLTRWQNAYQKNETPWDMGSANPLFKNHSQKIIDAGQKLFIPGAGKAHEAIYFESFKKELTLSDLSPLARDEFTKTYPQSKANYLVCDSLTKEFKTKNSSRFDVVIENYFFVAIPPSQRNRALSTIHSVLKNGGLYSGIFFLRSAEGGPPHGLSQYELKRFTEEHGFKILEWQLSPHSHPARLHQELWATFQKVL